MNLCTALLADAERAGPERDRRLCVAAANRIAELEAALVPFASYWSVLRTMQPGGPKAGSLMHVASQQGWAELTTEDFETAARAIEK